MFKLILGLSLLAVATFGASIHDAKFPSIGRVVFFGDSITDAFDSDGKATWDVYYGSLLARNVAVSGDRTQNTIDRILAGGIDSFNVGVAVLMIGTNDLAGGLEVDYVVTQTRAIIDLIQTRNPGVKVLLQGILPRNDAALHLKIRSVNSQIADYADGTSVFFVDMEEKFQDGLGVVKPELFTDGLHLTAAGYVEWARTIAPTFNQIYSPTYRGKVVFLGDSITQGWNGQATYNEKYVPLGVVNNGVGGDVTQQTIDRIIAGNLDGLNSTLAVLKIGTNDLGRGISEEEIASNIAIILGLIREKCPKAKILLLGILPRSGVDIATRAENVNNIIEAHGYGTTYIKYLNMRDVFQISTGVVDPAVMPDGLHLSALGYQMWADTMDPIFNNLLNKDL